MTKYRTPLKDQFTSTKDGLLDWHRERTVLEVTELICGIMQEEGVSRKELAVRLGKTKGYVSQLLDGEANMTLHTVSDLCTVLGHEFRPSSVPIAATTGPATFRMVIPFGDGTAENGDEFDWLDDQTGTFTLRKAN